MQGAPFVPRAERPEATFLPTLIDHFLAIMPTVIEDPPATVKSDLDAADAAAAPAPAPRNGTLRNGAVHDNESDDESDVHNEDAPMQVADGLDTVAHEAAVEAAGFTLNEETAATGAGYFGIAGEADASAQGDGAQPLRVEDLPLPSDDEEMAVAEPDVPGVVCFDGYVCEARLQQWRTCVTAPTRLRLSRGAARLHARSPVLCIAQSAVVSHSSCCELLASASWVRAIGHEWHSTCWWCIEAVALLGSGLALSLSLSHGCGLSR